MRKRARHYFASRSDVAGKLRARQGKFYDVSGSCLDSSFVCNRVQISREPLVYIAQSKRFN